MVGEYRLVRQLGEGGAGTVFEALHRLTGEAFALKVLAPLAKRQDVLMRRFEQEFRAANRLDHPNLVRAVAFGEAGGYAYLVMELVVGESLGEKVQRDGRMPEAEAVALAVQVCQALHYAHENGVIHRDVKPDNVLVTPQGRAKLIDLGLVKVLTADQQLTRAGGGLGTPHFMAPEQFRDARNADLRCDVYGLGATLYQLVTGQLPFGQSSPLECWMKKVNNDLPKPRSLVPTLSGRTDRAIRLAMAPQPADRPPSMPAFAVELTGRRLPPSEKGAPDPELLHLMYSDQEGQTYTLKLAVDKLRQLLASGSLANARDLRGSRDAGGPYRPLETFDEFRDLPIPGRPAPAEAASSRKETVQIRRPAPDTRRTPTVAGAPGLSRSRAAWVWVVVAVLAALAAGWVLFWGW
jgi:serine/threonine protein kinase